MAEGSLAGLRILECGDFVAAPYAAALLGHLGADVAKVEPPEGDSNRRRGPYPGGKPSPETSGLHLFLDQAKRSVVLDLGSEAGRDRLRGLASAADLLIVSGSVDSIERRALTYAALSGANPRLVVTTVTPFGFNSKRRALAPREICDLAAGGWLSISPGALEDPDLPPLKPFGQQAHFQAGVSAAVASLAALLEAGVSGRGQLVDVSIQATTAAVIEAGHALALQSGLAVTRLGDPLLGPWGIIQLADGHLLLICATEDEWQRLVSALGTPDWAVNPAFADRFTRATNNGALLALIEAELADRSVAEAYLQLAGARIACAPANTMSALLTSAHLEARQGFVAVDHPIAGRWTYPGPQWKLSATPWEIGRPAPLLDEHGEEVEREWIGTDNEQTSDYGPTAPAARAAAQDETDRAPLKGVEVIEFTWVYAGPGCGMQLAHLGADVIKVESASRRDLLRASALIAAFRQYNQGKRGVALDLKHPDALQATQRLIRRADVVIDNFGAGAMERLGLGYAALRAINPDIIQISMSGQGQTGPAAHYPAYGPTQVATIGLAALTGYPGGKPREVGYPYGDPNAALHAALAVLAALRHRRRTGAGQFIDMSQWEAALPLVVEGLLTYQMTGGQPPRMGNRDEFQAPQGVFRCAGEDDWVAVSCWSDAEWQALAGAIARPELAEDPRLATALGRKACEADLEAAITAWTTVRSREEAAEALKSAGVPAFPVLTLDEVAADPDLTARGFWVEHPLPDGTIAHQLGIPWIFSATPLRVRRRAPELGEHTDEVLREVAGLSAEEIKRLRDGGALQ